MLLEHMSVALTIILKIDVKLKNIEFWWSCGQKIVLTYSGDTTDGTWDDGDGIGMKLEFGLAGAQSAYATSDLNTLEYQITYFFQLIKETFLIALIIDFFITGIQLEIGNNATDFEHRSYGEELALCQRIFVHIIIKTLVLLNGDPQIVVYSV